MILVPHLSIRCLMHTIPHFPVLSTSSWLPWDSESLQCSMFRIKLLLQRTMSTHVHWLLRTIQAYWEALLCRCAPKRSYDVRTLLLLRHQYRSLRDPQQEPSVSYLKYCRVLFLKELFRCGNIQSMNAAIFESAIAPKLIFCWSTQTSPIERWIMKF